MAVYAHLCMMLANIHRTWTDTNAPTIFPFPSLFGLGCEAFQHTIPIPIRTPSSINTNIHTKILDHDHTGTNHRTSSITSLSMSSTQKKNGKASSISDSSSSGGVQINKPIQNRSPAPIPAVVKNLNAIPSVSESVSAIKDEHNSKASKCLKHVAFICDGNSRWGKKIKESPSPPPSNDKFQMPFQQQFQDGKDQMDKIRGHSKGAQQITALVQHIQNNYPFLQYMTIYGFSSENWSRPQKEIDGIFHVIERTAVNIREWAIREGLRIRLLGDCEDERIPKTARDALMRLERDSNENVDAQRMISRSSSNNIDNDDGDMEGEVPLTLCLAVNYGGRNDIVSATRKIADLVQKGEMKVEDIQQDTIENLLGTCGIPDPDLIIRTGGEKRLSNFLIWNCAYSELYFTDELWPDFGGDELDEALDWYYGRDRRFGGSSNV